MMSSTEYILANHSEQDLASEPAFLVRDVIQGHSLREGASHQDLNPKWIPLIIWMTLPMDCVALYALQGYTGSPIYMLTVIALKLFWIIVFSTFCGGLYFLFKGFFKSGEENRTILTKLKLWVTDFAIVNTIIWAVVTFSALVSSVSSNIANPSGDSDWFISWRSLIEVPSNQWQNFEMYSMHAIIALIFLTLITILFRRHLVFIKKPSYFLCVFIAALSVVTMQSFSLAYTI